MDKNLVQIYDPRTRDHLLIDLDAKCILARKQTVGPYPGVIQRGTTSIDSILGYEKYDPVRAAVGLFPMLIALAATAKLISTLTNMEGELNDG